MSRPRWPPPPPMTTPNDIIMTLVLIIGLPITGGLFFVALDVASALGEHLRAKLKLRREREARRVEADTR